MLLHAISAGPESKKKKYKTPRVTRMTRIITKLLQQVFLI